MYGEDEMKGRTRWDMDPIQEYVPARDPVRQPAHERSRAISEAHGYTTDPVLLTCETCDLRRQCIQAVIEGGPFANVTCDLALQPGKPHGRGGSNRGAGRKPVGYALREVYVALSNGNEMNMHEIRVKTRLGLDAVRRAIHQLMADGIVEMTQDAQGSYPKLFRMIQS